MLLLALQVPAIEATWLAAVAAATGLTPADIRPRLAGPGPWVLAVSADSDALTGMVPALTKLQVRAVLCDPSLAPGDADRVIVRTLSFATGSFVATDVAGQGHACPYSSVSLIQPGTRVEVSTETIKTTQVKFSAARALLTGGLSLTKKEVIEQTKKSEHSERFVLLTRNDGENDLMLYERRLNYQFLGSQMQASSFGNFELTVALLRSRTAAVVDEKVTTPGFVGRLPKTRANPADLALYLVQLAHLSL